MDINQLVMDALTEQQGFHGAEMYNDKYPSYQDDGGREINTRSGSVLNYGTSKNFDVSSNLNSNSGSVLRFGNQSSFARDDSLNSPNGKSVLRFKS